MKKINKIISLMLSAQIVTISVFATTTHQQRPKSISRKTTNFNKPGVKPLLIMTGISTVLLPVGIVWFSRKQTGLPDVSLSDVWSMLVLNRKYSVVDCIQLWAVKDDWDALTKKADALYKDVCSCQQKLLDIASNNGRRTSQKPSEVIQEFLTNYKTLQEYAENFEQLSDSIVSTKYQEDLRGRNIYVDNLKSGKETVRGFVYKKSCCLIALNADQQVENDRNLKNVVDAFYGICCEALEKESATSLSEVKDRLSKWYNEMEGVFKNFATWEQHKKTTKGRRQENAQN